MSAKYVPIDDVAEYFSVSISTIRAWLRRDRIPDHTYIKVGNTYRFCIEDVTNALREEVLEELEATELPAEGEMGGEVISYGAARREKVLLSAQAPKDESQAINFDSLDEDQ